MLTNHNTHVALDETTMLQCMSRDVIDSAFGWDSQLLEHYSRHANMFIHDVCHPDTLPAIEESLRAQLMLARFTQLPRGAAPTNDATDASGTTAQIAIPAASQQVSLGWTAHVSASSDSAGVAATKHEVIFQALETPLRVILPHQAAAKATVFGESNIHSTHRTISTANGVASETSSSGSESVCASLSIQEAELQQERTVIASVAVDDPSTSSSFNDAPTAPQAKRASKDTASRVDTFCRCKNSRCLKLYCKCFDVGSTCGALCKCTTCGNTESNADEIALARKTCFQRHGERAFRPERRRTHCNCANNACQKLYCVCIRAGRPCSEYCRCHGNESCCKNMLNRA